MKTTVSAKVMRDNIVAELEPDPVVFALTQRVPPLPSMEDADVLVTACGWCERVKLGDEWVEADQAIRRLRTYENDAPPSFTHSICGPCFDSLERRRKDSRS